MINSSQVELHGITWKHTRGLVPMQATTQRFEELYPNVRISWQTRSLQSFADEPLDVLAQKYDLLVIDHPSTGIAAKGGILLPLDEILPSDFLKDQAENSVGASHQSYINEGHLWAVAIDAATPVSLCRPELLRQAGGAPRTWEDLLDLARQGVVALPGLAIDSLMNFYMLCLALGEAPFSVEGQVTAAPVSSEAMRLLRELLLACGPEWYEANPIKVWNRLAAEDGWAYCPFAYGYSNYSRRGYADHIVEAGELIRMNGAPLRSTLGGAGLAISAHCAHRDTATAYAQFVASGQCQRTLYFDSGGQPGHRTAWLDQEVNRRSNGFFERTLPVLDRAWLRPRFDGYLQFQQQASELLHHYLIAGGEERDVADEMNRMLRQALPTRRGGAA
ncbi:ABC transporter substrate-binding protein [Acidipila rosea]|nr:extracellular solute-binding protein [Acidipila rosea]